MVSSLLPLRVLIVADDPLARAGLAAMLTGVPDCRVVGQSRGDGDMATALEVYRPDVVLWDMGWEPLSAAASAPGSDDRWLALAHLMEVRDAGHAVVALLADDAQVTALWAAGVRCLLLREVSAEKLISALAAAVQGLVVLEEALVSAVLSTSQLVPGQVTALLTRREFDVLRLLAEGLPNKIIADRLQISEHTVKFHVNALMAKLHAQSRTEAVVRAIRAGVLPL
jgi:two-component system, NarL family, nitrate/nitrite response regulator NarL